MSDRVATLGPGQGSICWPVSSSRRPDRSEVGDVKTSDEVSADKLRGGFYSPQPLVQVCLDRVQRLLPAQGSIRILEPSAGDGAFIAGLASHPLAERVSSITAIELLAREAATCRARLSSAKVPGEVVNSSVLKWASAGERGPYDAAVGNPPFVRFQFVDPAERGHADRLAHRLGIELRGVSNLWLPVLVSALAALRPGGAFAFIVPAECFTGVSGHEVREWLLARVQTLNVDLFASGSFPGVLQEVVILSGQIVEEGRGATRNLQLTEHGPGHPRSWTHRSIGRHRTWTRFLLSETQVACLEEAEHLPSVTTLSSVARFEVATVTGANSYFCVNEDTVTANGLRPWARPLLSRTRHAEGLVYTSDDHDRVIKENLSAYLLDFSADRADPATRKLPNRYLASGEAGGLPDRYKCRIRAPWYRVPVVAPGAMLMAKRSHLYPRVIVNDAEVLTTDTIYRGRMLPGASLTSRDFTAAFHNSLTLLTSEIEGRSFGGGVLELVPSEVSRLKIPLPEAMSDEFDRLDWVCRSTSGESSEVLVEETDNLVAKKTDGLDKALFEEFRAAREVLLNLRLARN